MQLLHKLRENALCVLPIMAIVVILHFTAAPLATDTMIRFCIGGVLVVFGLSLFLMGAEIGVLPMGEAMGSTLSKDSRIWLVALVGLLMGFSVTVAEPDLQVLAQQVFDASSERVAKMLLLLIVSAGSGFFVMLGLLRTLFNIPLKRILLISYILVFAIAAFTSPDFLAVGFDAGGVTTGPMTVPFILALGVGVAAVRGGTNNQDDSFGLVAMMSIGPVLSVLLLGVIYK